VGATLKGKTLRGGAWSRFLKRAVDHVEINHIVIACFIRFLTIHAAPLSIVCI